MTAKEYLNRVRLTDKRIKIKNEELYHLQLSIAQISPQTNTERVKSSNESGFMQTVDKIIDLQTDINAEIDKLVDLKNEARNKINQLDDERYIIVLTEYYINCKTFEQTAIDNNYSKRHVLRLHGWALQSFRKKYDTE